MVFTARWCRSILPLLILALPSILFSQTKFTSPAALAQRSEVVAIAKVTSLIPEWNSSRSSIQTRVHLSVAEYLKGSGDGSSLTLVVPGGEIDGVGEVYSEMPRFRENEEVFVFAKKDARGLLRVSGGSQGKYTIQKNELTGKLSVAGETSVDEFSATIRTALQAQTVK
jgi:hypothetical protein